MKNFLFDLYGTLVDIKTDEQSKAFWRSVAGLLNSDSSDAVKRRYAELCADIPVPDGGEFDLYRVMTKLTGEFGAGCGAEEFARKFRTASLRRLRVYGGAAEMLEALRLRGAKLYLISNAQACFTRYELEKLSLSDKFDGIILSSEAGWKKPSEKFFKAAFEKFSLNPEECVYIGNDLYDDVFGARSVGMRSVYIKTRQSGKYSQNIPVDMSVKNFGQLKRLLYRLSED